jgi:predicted RNA methylase
MLTDDADDSSYLGQFIPLHYHHNMLMDARRMRGFRSAIDYMVPAGARVLEFGGGTGVLSWFAALKADKVWCVEMNPDLVREARRFLSRNREGHRVQVVQADAFEYLPPEPVDVVICEMIHVAMLREKQIPVLESFKRRYRERFGPRLPAFVPEAAILAVQPLQQDYDFEGYHAPIVQFQEAHTVAPGTVELAAPAVYATLDYSDQVDETISWEGSFLIQNDGTVNALRFITKNILAVLIRQGATIDWLNHYLALPLHQPVEVKKGDVLRVGFQYRAGGSIPSLQNALRVEVDTSSAVLLQE